MPRKTDLDDGGLPPSQEAAEELLARLPEAPGYFVSFQQHDALALNPDYSNDVTPQGIYAFPADWLRLVVEAHLRTGGGRTRLANQGCVRRDNVFVFSVSGRIIEPPQYRDYLADATLLEGWLQERHPEGLGPLHAFTHNGRPQHGGDMDGQRLLYMTEKVTDRILGINDPDEPFAGHPDKPRLWREVFSAMGIHGLLDRQGRLTGGDFPHQLVVFDPDVIQLQASFPNPCRRDRPASLGFR